MSNYQQLCWIHITIIAIIVCSVTGSNTNESYDYPPVIVGLRDSQDIYLNDQNVLECSAEGLQPMKYTWFLNGEMITNTSVFLVKIDGTLVIKSTTNKTYTGTYHCIATNDIGVARSGDRHAYVADIERYRPSPNQPEYPVLNYPFVLNCSKDLVKFSRPWPPTFSWTYENSTPFTVDDESALVFSNYRDTDPKEVKCEARNKITGVEFSLVYKLKYNLEVQGHQNYISTDQAVLEGRHVSLYCVFHNSSDGSMTWTKDGEDIPDKYSPTFEINATSSDAGLYQCSKGNSSHVIRVIVDAKAKIEEFGNTTNNRVRVGDSTAKFSCSFSGRPEPNITWLIDGVPITTKFSNPAQYYESTDVSDSPYRSDLILFNVSYNASVICKASNTYGSQLSGSYVMAYHVSDTPEQLTTDVTTTETTDDSKYLATSTQNQQDFRTAVNGRQIGGQNDVANHLILAVALSVSVSIIVTFVMVLVICFVLRTRNDIGRAVDVQDQEQPPSFVENRQKSPQELELELIRPLTSPQHEHEEIP